MRDVVKLLLRPVSVLSLGLSTMGMMSLIERLLTNYWRGSDAERCGEDSVFFYAAPAV